eukprot:TRINITY_DN21914_c0_g1_i1.p1 TRINITY_DN21914_c0_g1~~TRINITY_DN21914_c0_g1_i1.p1  ORF type:complete len:328 (+),score=98.50 TRINITY_DN21914_c0_g1_i1:49-984(+)
MDISLASEWSRPSEAVDPDLTFVTPGDVITRESGFMRGHGTYAAKDEEGDEDILLASLGGIVKRVNKLIRVLPLRSIYQGEIGDVLVGRISEVQQRRWKVDVNSRLDAVLQLSSVNLPGGELRRRSSEDELAMRSYLREGDLISAEVQTLYKDGSMSIHTRSLKYGKLEQGTLLKVSPSLIKRQKTHFHNLLGGVSVILGLNGFIWLSIKSSLSSLEEEEEGNESYNKVTEGESGSSALEGAEVEANNPHATIARLRNVILALAGNGVLLWDTSIIYGLKASENYEPKDLLKRDIMYDVAKKTRLRLDADV